MAVRPPILLPWQWSRHVKSGILPAISLAWDVAAVVRGRADGRKRLRAQLHSGAIEFVDSARMFSSRIVTPASASVLA